MVIELEIVSFTALGNLRSRAVMARLAMLEAETFAHPHLAEGSALRPHCLYRLPRGRWSAHTGITLSAGAACPTSGAWKTHHVD